MIPIPSRRSTVALRPSESLSASSSSAVPHRRSLVSSAGLRLLLSRNATGFDQDDAAGLDAEHAFDYHDSIIR